VDQRERIDVSGVVAEVALGSEVVNTSVSFLLYGVAELEALEWNERVTSTHEILSAVAARLVATAAAADQAHQHPGYAAGPIWTAHSLLHAGANTRRPPRRVRTFDSGSPRPLIGIHARRRSRPPTRWSPRAGALQRRLQLWMAEPGSGTSTTIWGSCRAQHVVRGGCVHGAARVAVDGFHIGRCRSFKRGLGSRDEHPVLRPAGH